MGTIGTHSDGVPVVSYCVRTAAGHVLAERDGDRSFYAASTVKLAVLAAAARAVERGDLTLTTQLASQDRFTSEADGAPAFAIDPDDVDHGMPPPGTPMPLADVVERMIVVSSNEATNMIIELLGKGPVNQMLADAGAPDSCFGRKYSDFAAAAIGESHRVTARDLAALMAAVVTGALADAEPTAWMVGLLTAQTDRLLTAHVPAGVPCGSKSGSTRGIRHDVAFIGPNGDDAPGPRSLVVAVCTKGFDEPEADEMIRALGEFATSAFGVIRSR